MSRQRISADRLLWLESRLSDRDKTVLDWVARLRLVSGVQLETLAFGELSGHSRSVVRGRVLGRLVSWGLLELVDRRIGGAGSGSTSGVYRLNSAGQTLLEPAASRATKPYTSRFTAHTLQTAQLAVALTAVAQRGLIAVSTFVTEPTSWVPDGLGSYLKPDAYFTVQTADDTLHWWAEIDRGTESLPTLIRKLETYLDFVARGQSGPADLIPRVLIVCPDDRLADLQIAIDRLPMPASALFVVSSPGRAVVTVLEALRE